ncbi:hypothetical protein Pcatena_06680 [Parolsenella catena]|uniref:HEPN AbiJ-N-terminal domain-containing protein n=1 Tax=Parolsenella catena TaxID=2003188 RepID=A0A3G9JX67_9ACTN|nr:hypothetical protein [Parolsenella catena]BBH50081.1 hypothetical protein Pcatena_06680 [Parolsenella catena]
MKRRLFSQRYDALDRISETDLGDGLTDNVTLEVKRRLADVMLDFCEPLRVKSSRYDNTTYETDALSLAIEDLNDTIGYNLFSLGYMTYSYDEAAVLTNVFTPHLFDIIELQYDELSDDVENGKEGFRKEINRVFQEHDCPWLFTDGRLVKVDAKQFELDLKLKAIERMQELRDANPLYQGAYDELRKAVDFLGRGDYAEAVINAGKSYESVLKVICGPGAETESANGLIKRLLESDKLSLPESLKPEAFQNSVLLSFPIIRNKVAAHGSGATECEISAPMANLAVNLACALDTYLIQEATDIE